VDFKAHLAIYQYPDYSITYHAVVGAEAKGGMNVEHPSNVQHPASSITHLLAVGAVMCYN
jgi:hypothetical protein